MLCIYFKSIEGACLIFGMDFPRVLALHACNHAAKLAPGWGQRSIARMIMIKYLVKVFKDI